MVIFGASATHALRALAHLAAREDGGAMLGRDLAREVEIPPHYLAKVLAKLARAGVLAASRGVRGGYRLSRPAGEITLADVLAPIEGRRVRPGCLLRPDQPCREDGACPAHAAWSEVNGALSEFLASTTLADLRGGVVPPLGGGRGKRPRRPRSSTRSNPRRRATR